MRSSDVLMRKERPFEEITSISQMSKRLDSHLESVEKFLLFMTQL